MSERSDSEYDDLYNLNNFKDDILFKEYSTMDGDDDDNDLFGDESGLGFGVDDYDDAETSTRSSTSRNSHLGHSPTCFLYYCAFVGGARV